MTTSAIEPAPPAGGRVRRRRSSTKPKITEITEEGEAGWTAAAVAAMTVLAPFLGGSTTLWAEAVLAIGAGLFLLFAPPGRRLGWPALVLMSALIALALMAFLPFAKLGMPAWRVALGQIDGVELPASLSPQPWLTAEGVGLSVAILAWAAGLFGITWNNASRGRAVRLFGSGIIALAALAVLSTALKFRVPFWPEVANSPIHFGFFPNRNQMANLLAIGGIMVSAIGSEDLREGKRSAWWWFAGLLVICVGLTMAYSRAGIILFFGGLSLWALLSSRMAGSPKVAALVVTSGALLLALFFLFGGQTLERFHGEPTLAKVGEDFRMAVFRDAWRVAWQAPWLGHGLGNFEPIFALAREASAMPNRPIHPESDWLWAAVELGWLAPLLILGLTACWAWRCFPFAGGAMPRLRCAAAVAVAGFAAHGLVDVSGHRFGTLWPALFLASIASGAPRTGLLPSWWRGAAWRLLALAPVAIGLWWLGSYRFAWPTSATHQRLSAEVEAAPFRQHSSESIERATAALRIAPLDWNLYFQRGLARAVAGDTVGAVHDTLAARALEPNWSDFCYTTGVVWMELGQPVLAVESWRQVIVRPGEDSVGLYRQMLVLTEKRPGVRELLREWAHEKKELLLQFLERATPLEFELEAGRLLDSDPTLSTLNAKERTQLFAAWAERDATGFADAMKTHPEWLAEGWLLLARGRAAQGEYRAAWQLAQRFGPKPPIPNLQATQPLPALEREFFLNRGDLIKGLTLYYAERRAGRIEDAKLTLEKLRNVAAPPYYLKALEADVEAELGDWRQAWESWQAYQAEQAKVGATRPLVPADDPHQYLAPADDY